MRRQYFGSPLTAQDWFIDDFEEQWDLLETEIITRQTDLFTKGVVGDPTITIGSTTELTLPAFNFYLDGELIEVSAGDITIDTSTDGTFKVFASYTEDTLERTETRERRIVSQKHKRLDYTPDYSISTSADPTKVQICEIIIMFGNITNVDNTDRDYITPELGNLDLDDIPDGTTYSRLKTTEADWLNNTVSGDAHKVMMKNGSGVTEHDLIDDNNIETGYNLLTDDELYEAGLNDLYGEEVTIKPQFGELYIDSSMSSSDIAYLINNNGQEFLHGDNYYSIRTGSLSTGDKLIEIQGIPARPFESFEVELDMMTSDTSNSIKIQIDAVDKDDNIISQTSRTSASCSATFTVERKSFNTGGSATNPGSFYANQADACKVNISVIVQNYVGSSQLYFTPPIIRRKSKNGKEYRFTAEGDNTGSWTIAENTDQKLSSVSYNSTSNYLELSFAFGFLNDNEEWGLFMIPSVLNPLTNIYFNNISDGGGIDRIFANQSLINNLSDVINVYLYDNTDTVIDFERTHSSSYTNKVTVILKRISER